MVLMSECMKYKSVTPLLRVINYMCNLHSSPRSVTEASVGTGAASRASIGGPARPSMPHIPPPAPLSRDHRGLHDYLILAVQQRRVVESTVGADSGNLSFELEHVPTLDIQVPTRNNLLVHEISGANTATRGWLDRPRVCMT